MDFFETITKYSTVDFVEVFHTNALLKMTGFRSCNEKMNFFPDGENEILQKIDF